MERIKIGEVAKSIDKADASIFDPDVYAETGFFVLRDVVPQTTVATWQTAWDDFYSGALRKGRKVNPFNTVHVHEREPVMLQNIHRTPEILDVMETLYPDLGLFMQRFVIKDAASRGKVFVHGDFGYDYGWPRKTTVFIPLSESNEANGGISFYPGTHHFGYMGDAGEVNTDLLDPSWPLITPHLRPGDIALCHTCTWHCSPPYRSGPDRILVQATYQPADDPSCTVFLRGTKRPRYPLRDIPRDKFFARSRSSRLRELQAELDEAKRHEPAKVLS